MSTVLLKTPKKGKKTIVAEGCYCRKYFHFIPMASSNAKNGIKDLTQKSEKTSCTVKVMPELKCKMRRSGSGVAMQEMGWSQAPGKGFTWYLAPCPKTSTKGSGNFTPSLTAGGMQHKAAKLSSANKECLLTLHHLTIVTLFWSRLLKLTKPKRLQPPATASGCTTHPISASDWRARLWHCLIFMDIHARVPKVSAALTPPPAHLKWELMLLLIHLGCLCSPEYFWWLLGNHCWIHAWGVNCLSTLKEENSLKLRTLPHQK